MILLLFHTDGSIREHTVLSTKDTLLYRIGADQWHVMIPLTPTVIFHETKIGPMTGTETMFAPWAPAHQYAGKTYIRKLIKSLL